MTDVRLTPRGYEVEGTVYPRVSTILNIIAAPGLEAWRHKVGLEESRRIGREAAGLGTRVHGACEAISRGGGIVAHDDDLAEFIQVYEAWFHRNVAEVVAVEQFVWSAKYGYAGTLDLIADLKDGRRALVDLKTSQTVSETHRLQTAAYQLAALEAHEIGCDVRLIVQMPSRKPGELYVTEFDDDAGDQRAWRATLALYKWQRRHAGMWKKQGVKQ